MANAISKMVSSAFKQFPAGAVGASSVPYDRGGWWHRVSEPFTGAWQRNMEQTTENITAHSAVYSCVTLIAQDISKLWLRLVELDLKNKIWVEAEHPAFSPVLRKPNHYQNRIKFIEYWIISKLLHGNTYILKEYDDRGVVVAMYILDPNRVKVLVALDGSIFYELRADNLTPGLENDVVIVPASEIIHDIMSPLYHPLCGVSPLTACGAAAIQGLAIQKQSTEFFLNGAQEPGILSSEHDIQDHTANRIREHWEQNYTGANRRRIAVLGNGLKFSGMMMKSTDAQLIEQLKWTAEVICSCFHVPGYKIGVGTMPSVQNLQALNIEYYNQCLQALVESIELCLDEGLGIGIGVRKDSGKIYGAEFDVEGLWRMDALTQMDVLSKGKETYTPNEGRRKVGLPGVKGGDTVYRQQQDYSLEALSKRDAKDDPFAKEPTTPALPKPGEGEQPQPPAPTGNEDDDQDAEEREAAYLALFEKCAREALHAA